MCGIEETKVVVGQEVKVGEGRRRERRGIGEGQMIESRVEDEEGDLRIEKRRKRRRRRGEGRKEREEK